MMIRNQANGCFNLHECMLMQVKQNEQDIISLILKIFTVKLARLGG